MSDVSDRTIPATPRRRQAAEEQGLVPTAGGVAWGVACLVTFACLPAWLRASGQTFVGWLRDLFSTVGHPVADHAPPPSMLVPLALGLVVAAAAATLGVRVLFDRVRFRPARCLPDFQRVGPFRGVARIFSARTATRAVEAAVAVTVVAAVAVVSVGRFFTGLGETMLAEPTESLMLAWRSLWPVLAVAAVASFVRWAMARVGFERRLRMTPQEYQEELRSLEADPKVKLQRHTPRRVSESPSLVPVRSRGPRG